MYDADDTDDRLDYDIMQLISMSMRISITIHFFAELCLQDCLNSCIVLIVSCEERQRTAKSMVTSQQSWSQYCCFAGSVLTDPYPAFQAALEIRGHGFGF
jgi:hypothetical protein